VTDAAVLLGAGVGVDAHDAATAAQAGHAFKDYTRFLDAGALKGARIGVWHSYDPDVADPATVAIFKATVEQLKGLGATVVDTLEIDFGPGFEREFDALLCEFKTDIASYLAAYTGTGYPKTLQDLIDFNNAHKNLEGPRPGLPWNNLVFDLAEATGGRSDPDCAAARAATTPVIQAAIDDAMAANDLDAIVAPTNNPAWVTDPVNGDSFDGYVSSSSAAAVSGYAGITVANGFVGPLPVGVSFIGGRWSEPTLIGLAYAYEQGTHVRVPPRFLPQTQLDSARSARQPAKQGQRRAIRGDRRPEAATR
jgi:amidase